MLTFLVPIITLSLVIGNRGFAADITPSTQLETQGAEEQNYYEKEESSTNWECQPDSHFLQEQISLTTKLLQDGDQFMKKQQTPSADETILVLGKAGTGKTSLVQFLIDSDKLRSREINANTGEYFFEDGDKVGTSATESFTLFPDIFNFNSGVNFCDSPGFHDSRSLAHEIVSMNAMKSITKHFKKVKILIVETHSVLQYGVAKDSFIKTLRYLNDFVVDIDKYRDSLAVIATKVPLTYGLTDDVKVAGEIVTDDEFVESILHYLNQTEISLTERLKYKKSRNDEEFFKKVIKVLKSLQTQDQNGKPSRINIFRRPYSSGSHKTMELMVKNRKSILQTVFNLNSVEVKHNDFDYTLSNAAKMYLECILQLTTDSYKNKINKISFKLTDYITQNTQNYTSFQQVLSELDILHKSLKSLSQNLENTTNYNEFFALINGFLTEHKIPVEYNFNGKSQVLEKYEEMLLKFVDISKIFIPSSWTLPIRQVVKNVEGELNWYQTLNKYIHGLSAYEIQKNKSEIYNSIFRDGTKADNDLMTLFMSVTDSKDFEQFMESRQDERKRKETELITESLLKNSNITCDINGKLVVEGFIIRLSEINSENLLRIFCNDTKLTEVVLLAVDTVYLDEDTEDLFQGIHMFIAAPTWVIIGGRKIVLSGVQGQEMTGNIFVDEGKNGRPGLPGGNGGNFFGIGLNFLNGGNLKIVTNGGRGGRGEDGGKGVRGEDGKDGAMTAIDKIDNRERFGFVNYIRTGYKSKELTKDIIINNAGVPKEMLLYDSTESYNRKFINSSVVINVTARFVPFRFEGECGGKGGPGGLGGEAGLGGNPGDHKLIELGDSSSIYFENNLGERGKPGKMGGEGDRGANGIALTCFNLIGKSKVCGQWKLTSYWRCRNSDDSHVKCEDENSQLLNTSFEYSKIGMKQPSPSKNIDFIHNLHQFSIMLNRQSSNTLFHKTIEDFIKAFKEKKPSHNLNMFFNF